MDIQLILGPNNSGKSLYAENLAVENADSPLFYLATMIPQTDENHRRIEKHKKQRFGKGFETIEEPWNIHELSIPSDAVVLLEDASNLLANGIFLHQADATQCFQRILTLAEHCKKLIIVSIGGLSTGNYDAETDYYINQLNLLNEKLEKVSSKCFKFCHKAENDDL